MLPDRRLEAVRVEIGLESRDEHLTLGIAEADVVLDHLRPLGREHDPAVQDAAVLGAARRSSVSVGQIARSITSSTTSFGTNGTGEYAPMPPGVRSLVVVEHALVVLRRRERLRVVSVAQHEHRQLGAGHALFDHARAAGVAERVARQVRAHCVTRVGDRLGDDHALARGEAVGLHDVQTRQRLEERERGRFLTGARTCRAGPSAPRLRRARPSSTPWTLRAWPRPRSGPNARWPAAVERVDDTRRRAVPRDRPRRGRVELVGERDHRDRDRWRSTGTALAERGHPEVAGRADDLVDVRANARAPTRARARARRRR